MRRRLIGPPVHRLVLGERCIEQWLVEDRRGFAMVKDRYEQQAWNAENRHTSLEELVPGSRNVVALLDFSARVDLLVAIKSRVSIALLDNVSTL